MLCKMKMVKSGSSIQDIDVLLRSKCSSDFPVCYYISKVIKNHINQASTWSKSTIKSLEQCLWTCKTFMDVDFLPLQLNLSRYLPINYIYWLCSKSARHHNYVIINFCQMLHPRYLIGCWIHLSWYWLRH